MAMAVMLIIIILNILLLLAVMRIGAREDFHDQFAAEQSSAVAALRTRLEEAAAAQADEPIVGAKDDVQAKPG